MGSGIVHGPSFINVYNNPILNTKPGRSHSRGGPKRRIKKNALANSEIVKVNDNDQSLKPNETVNSFNQ